MSELEQTYRRMFDNIPSDNTLKQDIQAVWATPQGKRLAWFLMRKAKYFDEVPTGHEVEFCALRNLVNEVFFLIADVQDIADTITKGDIYG